MKFPEEAAARWWNPVAMTRGAARFLGSVAWSEYRPRWWAATTSNLSQDLVMAVH